MVHDYHVVVINACCQPSSPSPNTLVVIIETQAIQKAFKLLIYTFNIQLSRVPYPGFRERVAVRSTGKREPRRFPPTNSEEFL